MTQEKFKCDIIPLQSTMQLLAERMLRDADKAEDVVQDTFLYLWQKRDELEQHPNLQGYALQMVRTRCIDQLRKQNIHDAHAESIRLMSDQAVIMEVDETQKRSAMLHRMLEQLPGKQRKIVEMKYLQDMDTPSIERALGMSSANVYTTLTRAMATLRDKIKKIEL